MKKDGQADGVSAEITVFVSLIMMCLFALLCVLAESARTAGARWYLQMAADSALDSVFSQYHRQLWDSYRLFFAEYDSKQEILTDFSDFIAPYLETENWYPMQYETAEVEELVTAFDGNGVYFEKEILDYMKYGVWKLDFDIEALEDVWKYGKEAEAVTVIAENYRGHASEALALEKALEAISENLAEQMEKKQEGLSCLRSYDNSGFQRKAKEWIRLLKKIPKLVEIYEKRADTLAAALEKSREACGDYRNDCSEQVDELLEAEIQQYEAYVSLDGTRRKEIEALLETSAAHIQRVQEVMEEADEVEEIIENWEDDDEDDDGPDLDALWRPVIRAFDNIVIPSLSFTHGVKDKEKEGLLNRVAEMYRSGMLALLLPEKAQVSDCYISLKNLPSQAEAMVSGGRTTSLFHHLMVDEYCGAFFKCFTDTMADSETDKEQHALCYEMEYLLAGKASDEENLSEALHQLLAIREGLNLVHILSDSSKRAEARTLALAITGLAGITPLVMVTSFFVMSVWALGESIMDIRGLLAGKRVPIIKTSKEWTLDLENLLEMGSSQNAEAGGGENGLGYGSWLKVLLFFDEIVQQEQRMMDVMQVNLCILQSGFRMSRMVYEMKIKGKFRGKHVFFAIPFVDKFTGAEEYSYPMQVEAERVY